MTRSPSGTRPPVEEMRSTKRLALLLCASEASRIWLAMGDAIGPRQLSTTDPGRELDRLTDRPPRSASRACAAGAAARKGTAIAAAAVRPLKALKSLENVPGWNDPIDRIWRLHPHVREAPGPGAGRLSDRPFEAFLT